MIKKIIDLEINDCFIFDDCILQVIKKDSIDMKELCVDSPERFWIKFKLIILKSTIKTEVGNIIYSHTTLKNKRKVIVIKIKEK